MIPVRDTSVSRGFAPATAVIILINLAVFVEELRVGEQIFQLYAASPGDVYHYLTKGTGNILAIHWSILVSAFMHAGYIHLLGNMVFLSVFGPALEKRIGIIRYCLFYLAAALVAFYSHAVMYPTSPVPVVGASGAIAAVMGAYLVFNPKARILTIVPLIFLIEVVEIPSIVFMFVWFLLQGANGYLSIHSQTTVAWFSHIGGFLLGLILGINMRWFK
ncbi:MAG: Rhomboid family protein [Deltaproteobacteria bacterium ADurb.BinA179]|nr:rhomboid family intramembrane serine protease [Bacteriovoracaceae bacterium]OPZ27874.1 MAG: Rhomboid family protein [Deltaproteobacteria bacterium ADurb.BinA179]HNR50474.1 rhomboid family intramembrane serine protease [Deltaproteobacteria bacterium]HNU74284.1 rhomboid family intramembrane serine protease [Deltaproteobacteria bacterium]HOE72140.1 rhomboid family intramembrane serine protease [Deltaproteobacteria bacterium]